MDDMQISEDCVGYLTKHYSGAEDILRNVGYRQLRNFPRHKYTNTMDHSIRVACVNLYLADRFHVSEESAVKVGLLHDFCLVDYYEEPHLDKSERHPGIYAFYHPVEAVENAEGICELTETEKKAIKSHMFPLAVRIPTSRLGWLLTISDKIVATYESFYGIRAFHRAMISAGNRSVVRIAA